MISLSSILIRIAFLMLAVLGESKQIWYTSYTLGPQHYHYVDKQVSSQNDAMAVCRAINAKIWCPINEKESKLVYENILHQRLEGLIKGTEEISFSNFDNYILSPRTSEYGVCVELLKSQRKSKILAVKLSQPNHALGNTVQQPDRGLVGTHFLQITDV